AAHRPTHPARRDRRARELSAFSGSRGHHRPGHPDLRRRFAAALNTQEYAMKIIDIREQTKPIKSNIRNAYIDFSKMTLSLVAVVTDVVRDGKPVIGYGFNSNGRYGQGTLIRERIRARVLEAPSASLVDKTGDNLDPHKV